MISTAAAGPGDEFFLFEAFVSVRLPDFAELALSEAELESFMKIQYEARRRTYAERYPNLRTELVKEADEPIGFVCTAETADTIAVVDVALLKPYRGRGIGSMLIRRLQTSAAKAGKRIRLTVAMDNAALRLYQRLGFVPCGEAPPYVSLEWIAEAERSAMR